ncbi:AAA family ATPase [Candidatus Woesearchaeota archaeon]|nr:AAA family ATPase [Candidatus Woesearchaeota archaeon]
MTSKDDEVKKIVYGYSTEHDYLEEENRVLKETVSSLEQELSKYRKTPLISCEVKEMIEDKVLVRLPNGNEFLVDIADDCEKVLSGDTVLAEQKNLTVVKKISKTKRFDVEKFVIIEKPNTQWTDIGGLRDQEQEIKEVIELPLLKPKLFTKVGINPPKGILLHGHPGTGKTLLAKAVAASTNSTFIEVVGSELVQKFIGEGAKLVKEIFELAREKAPSIIFIDELDAIAATRMDVGTSGEREVQRTFMQLLAEIDGFKPLDNVKIIGCTNRIDILDPAITRPGRLDRLTEVPLPSEEAIKEIFKIHASTMSLCKIDADKIAKAMNGFSGAQIKAAVTEAGYFAIRENRTKVKEEDFYHAIEKVAEKEDIEYKEMFG